MFIEVNGVRLHAVSFGAGPRTFVATGGWTGSWEVWEEPIGLLTAAGWRCIAYDHRGAGESPVDEALIGVERLVADVAGVLDAFEVERCVLAGESQGGAIVQYAAARDPGRFDGLVLAAPIATGRRDGSNDFAAACRRDYPAAVEGFVRLCLPEADVDHVRRWARNILLRAEPGQAARMIEMWSDEDVPDVDPAGIDIPTLILHGTADALSPIEHSRALVELLPDAELVAFDGVGHVPTMTKGAEVFSAIERRFAAP